MANIAHNERETFVLGAGFSRAISDLMPITDELGNEVLSLDPDHLGRGEAKRWFASGSFESWLSRRAEDQPYLSEAENLENRSIFARATSLVARVLDDRVDGVLKSPMPHWLGELVSYWHLKQSDVLTFNYDTLIECAFETLQLWDWREETHFQWGSLLNYSPEGKAGHSYGEAEGNLAPHPSFRLWKLHGSLNWHWAPGDLSGSTSRRSRLPGTFGAPHRVSEDELHWGAPGRSRLIVPPAALKSGYYVNPVIREVWNRAYEALAGASSISLLGYSVPVTDLSTSGMIAEALFREPSPDVKIVDFSPGRAAQSDSLVERVRRLAPSATHISAVGAGSSAIPAYVGSLISAAAKSAALDLTRADLDDDTPIYIDWGTTGSYGNEIGRSAAVLGIRRRNKDGSVVLLAEPLAMPWHSIRSRNVDPAQGRVESLPLSFRELRSMITDDTRLKVRVEDARRDATIISFRTSRFEIGHGRGLWLQLVPAGGPY